MPVIDVVLKLSEEEFLDWNRAAQRAKTDLPAWVVETVRSHRAAASAQPARRRLRDQPPALSWLEDDPPMWCEYCGDSLDFTATRRKRFCSDICRVRAWRFNNRQAAAAPR
jgi:hypothetical protein